MSDTPIITAVPNGTCWRLKILGPDGKIKYQGSYRSRLEALGVAILMSWSSGLAVVP
jgi:hypothetical protein